MIFRRKKIDFQNVAFINVSNVLRKVNVKKLIIIISFNKVKYGTSFTQGILENRKPKKY